MLRSKRVETYLNCLSFPMYRSMRLRFLYVRFEYEAGSVRLTLSGMQALHSWSSMNSRIQSAS